ncbi:hypothetical protein Cni_G28732 [Canna indica]|uniref:Major facilitator superfamily (MFS) profile domain-containing protein n=1 Tax=Canna indica TaxID=4628 RepID=A0AAQ3L3X3_9LILI|nr:hypothetical protein Cni_G28732 [Canna indica]
MTSDPNEEQAAQFSNTLHSSLVQRGKLHDARAALRRVRGVDADVEAELKDIVHSVDESAQLAEGAFRRIVRRRYRPYLVMAVAIPLFQQLTGVIVIAFFSPVLFRMVGFGSDTALMSAVILGAVNLVSIIISTTVVDRYGRKFLFMIGGAQMILCQVYYHSSIMHLLLSECSNIFALAMDGIGRWQWRGFLEQK